MKKTLFACLMWRQFEECKRCIPTILLLDSRSNNRMIHNSILVIRTDYRIPHESLFEFKLRVTKEIEREYSDWVIVTENYSI